MKRKQDKASDLESELLRLNELVRARRKQLERLEVCPHTDCECRQVWHEVTESKLATQMGRVNKGVRSNGARKKTPKRKRSASSRK
jgi:hypothetical protein